MNRAALSCAVALGLTASTLGGDLNPPIGPVAPTMKTLDEVRPSTPIESLPGSATAQHVINQPGAYHLTGNMDLAGLGVTAIRIESSGVSINLNGFSISGNATETLPAIRTGGLATAIRNGSIRTWGGEGILAFSTVVIEDIHFDFVRGSVINVARGAKISDCLFRGCDPMELDGETLIKDCVFRDMARAIDAPAAKAVMIVDCVFDGQNTGNPGVVIHLGDDAKLFNVTVSNEGRSGVIAGNRASIIGCSFTGNNAGSNNGITVGSSCVIKNNIVFDYGGHGLSFDFSCVVSENTILSNGGDGIFSPFDRNVILNNTIASNVGNGISVRRWNRIEGNHISGSLDEGILATNDNMIVGNHVVLAPIRVTSGDNTIDSNVVTDPPSFAVILDTGSNRVTRNTLDGNISSGGTNLIGVIRTSANFASAGPWDNFRP